MLSLVRRLSFDAAAEFFDAPSAKWFTTPLNCPHSHPARHCPDMTFGAHQLIAGATAVESCRSSTAEMTQVLRAACRWRVSRSLHKCTVLVTVLVDPSRRFRHSGSRISGVAPATLLHGARTVL